MQISLSDIVLAGLQPFVITSQEYALALTARLRLNDEGFGFFVVKLLFEVFRILRE